MKNYDEKKEGKKNCSKVVYEKLKIIRTIAHHDTNTDRYVLEIVSKVISIKNSCNREKKISSHTRNL